MTQTFASVLHELAHMTGAVLHDSTVQSATSTTLVDAIELAGYADDDLNRLRAYIYAGTGAGQERRVTDFVASTGTLTTPAWSTTPDATSKYIVMRNGWRMADLRVAFIQAMRRRRRYYYVDKVDETLTLAVTNGVATYEYTVPAGFAAIERIVRENTASAGDFWTPIPSDAWYINRDSTKQIVFEKAANDNDPFIVNGLKIRVVGQAYETEPDADSDSLTIPTGALLLLAASHVFQNRRTFDSNNSAGFGQLASTYWQEWLNARGDDENMIHPGSREVEI